MAKYKVSFSGFAYIEANDEEEAKDLLYFDEFSYKETQIDEVEEVDDFVVEW